MNNSDENYDKYDIEKQSIFTEILEKRPSTEEINEVLEIRDDNERERETFYNDNFKLYNKFNTKLLKLIKKEKLEEHNLKLIIMTGQFLKPYLKSAHKNEFLIDLVLLMKDLQKYKARLTVNPKYSRLISNLESHFDLNDLSEFAPNPLVNSEPKPVQIDPPSPPPDNANDNSMSSLNSNKFNNSASVEGRIRHKKRGSVKQKQKNNRQKKSTKGKKNNKQQPRNKSRTRRSAKKKM